MRNNQNLIRVLSKKINKVQTSINSEKIYDSYTCRMSDKDNENRHICEADYNSIWTDVDDLSYNHVNLIIINKIGHEIIIYNAGLSVLNVHSNTNGGFTIENNTFNPVFQIPTHKIYKFTWGIHGGIGWQISEIIEPTL